MCVGVWVCVFDRVGCVGLCGVGCVGVCVCVCVKECV